MCRQRTWSARRSAPSNNGAPTVHADGSHLLALRCHKRPPLWIPRPFPTSTRPLACVTTRSLTPSRSLIILHCTVGVDKKDGEEPLRMLHVCYGGHRHVFGTIDPCNFRGARVLWCAGGLVVRCGVPARLPGKITCGRVVQSVVAVRRRKWVCAVGFPEFNPSYRPGKEARSHLC